MAKNQNVSLDDKYDLSKPLVFLSGTQAIVRLTLMQKERDRAGGEEHCRLCHRLSRLALGRARPAVHACEARA